MDRCSLCLNSIYTNLSVCPVGANEGTVLNGYCMIQFTEYKFYGDSVLWTAIEDRVELSISRFCHDWAIRLPCIDLSFVCCAFYFLIAAYIDGEIEAAYAFVIYIFWFVNFL